MTQQPDQQRETEARPSVDVAPAMAGHIPQPDAPTEAVFELKDVEVAYSGKPAVRDISFDIYKERITALIGPSGCGKSTLIRCLNRMNDLIPSARR